MGNEDTGINDLIDTHLPYDGPHSQDTVVDAARALNQLVRYLNNATQRPHTLEWGATIYRVLGGLNGTLSGLDQLLDQLGDATVRLVNDPGSYDDRRDRSARRGPIQDTTAQVASQIEAARLELTKVTQHVNSAHSAASHLGND